MTAAGVALFWLIATAWQPWRLFARAGFSADFYDEQARVLLRGRLAVDPAVAGIEGFVVDDRTYLYFGPLLAVARLPLAVTGSWSAGRLTLVSMLVALVVLVSAAARLHVVALRLLAGRGPDDRDRWRVLLWTGAVVGSPALALAGWISVYHETELWAAALGVLAAASILEFAESPTRRTLLAAGAATVATVLTRASVGIGVALALIAVALVVRRRAGRLAVAAVASAVAGVGVHIALNLAKFGSLLSIPADRQVLTMVDPERAAWFAGNDGSFFSARFLPTTIVHYLRPDTVRFERLVPGIRFGPPARDLGWYPVENVTPASSLTAAAPVLVVLAVVGAWHLVATRRWVWLAVVAGLVVGAVPSFTIGFVANRYLVDMLPALVAAGAAGLVVVRRPGRLPVRWGRAVVVLAVAWSVWVNAALGTWVLGLKSPGFTELRYRVDGAVFPAPSPGIVDAVPGGPVPRDGVVGVDPACDGVYVAEQGRWVALERADGRRIVRGVIAGEPGDRVVVRSSGWSVELRGSGDDGTVELIVDDESVAVLAAGPTRPGTSVEVVVDPVVPEFSVRAGGRLVLLDPTVPRAGQALEIVGLTSDGSSATPLCDLLQERR